MEVWLKDIYSNLILREKNCVDFKSDYNKTKISKMDISNIYF